MKKFLFLDIDGVLNHEDWWNSLIGTKDRAEYPYDSFDPKCVERINEIINKTGAKIVISSSWRGDPHLQEIFKNVGLPTDFDITTRFLDRFRGEEIQDYLDNVDGPYVYCIVDDYYDFMKSQKKNVVITANENFDKNRVKINGGTGLTDICKEKIIKILNGNINGKKET